MSVSEAQLHEGDRVWEGSVERNCEPVDKNRIEGGAEQGEWALFRKVKGNALQRRAAEGNVEAQVGWCADVN